MHDLLEDIEGPFWDYSRASEYATGQANMYARLSVEALLRVGGAKDARHWARQYAIARARCERIRDRYDATKDDELITWIGWQAQHTGRRA